MNFRREKFKMNFNSNFFSSSKYRRNTDWIKSTFLSISFYRFFFTTKTTQKVSQNKFILVVEIHFLFWQQTNFCTNGATLTFDGARGLTSTCHFSLEHVNDDVLLPRREPHVAGDVLSLAASSTHDVDGDQAGDPEVRVRPPVHLRHLRSDRARAGSAAGSTDPWTRRLHWR